MTPFEAGISGTMTLAVPLDDLIVIPFTSLNIQKIFVLDNEMNFNNDD